MRSQSSIEALFVIAMLMVLLLTVGIYAYSVQMQLESHLENAEFFKQCASLQTITLTSAYMDQNITALFLQNFTVINNTANTTINGRPYICPLIVPTNGEVIVPSNWSAPVNGTKFVSKDGLVNITWGLI